MNTVALEGFRFSVQQARLWSQKKNNQIYRALCAILMQGRLDRAILEKVLQAMVEQHEILRTGVYPLPGLDIPVQVVIDHAKCTCPVINLEHLDESCQREKLDELITFVQEKDFDLEHPPLLRTCLLQLSRDTHVLVISLPAFCADASTLRLFVAEFQQGYASYLQGEELADEPLQYADVSAWQDGLLHEEEATPQIHYWQEMELSQLNTAHLPFGRDNYVLKYTVEEEQTNPLEPQVLEVALGELLSRRINILAQQYSISVPSWLLTCWQVLLWRLSNQTPLLVGVACDGRIYEDLANALGLYTRFVPLSIHLERELPFEQVLLDVDKYLQEASERQLYFTWEITKSATNGAASPLFFPISFEYENWPAAFTSEGLTLSLYRRFNCIEPFSLKLSTLQLGECLRLELHYDQHKMTSDQAQRVASMLHTLLCSVVEQPQAPVGQLNILTLEEQEALLKISEAPTRLLSAQSLHQLFEAQVARVPHQQAVIDAQRALTYQELNCRANQLARALRRRGVGPNVLVALCASRSVEMIVDVLAILKAGGAYVPLDPQSPPARLAFQLQNTQASLLLTQKDLLPRFSSWEGAPLCVDAMTEELKQELESNLPVMSHIQDLAYVMYTSGSTGVPKGVMIQQQSVVNYTLAICELLKCEPGWQYATVSTLAADLGNTAIFCSLASGGCLQVLDYETITSGEAFPRWMSQHPIDVLKIVPSHLAALLAGERSLAPRRALIFGGEALPFGLLRQLQKTGSTCAVYNHYGPTEATVGVLVSPLGDLKSIRPPFEQAGEGCMVPLGRPITNSEVYVLDHSLQITPVGVEGELYLGGMGLASGYLGNAEQTAERFIPHPFSDQVGGRLYRTGDLAYYTAQGQVGFLGRCDNQVKLRGYRIELEEIEAVLRRCPVVQDAVVVLREDIHTEPCIVGYVVPKHKSMFTNEQLGEFARQYLPEYMVPFTYVILEALPFTTNGKVDRQRLPRPDLAKNDELAVSVVPRNLTEEMLLNIWKDLLPASEIGIHDNFFQLGGHSLLATQVISQIRAVFQVELPIQSLFEAPTVAELARVVELTVHGGESYRIAPLTAMERSQALPLSFAQQRLWFLERLVPNSSFYNISNAVWLSGALNIEALERSIKEVVQRHASLRTAFQVQEGQPVQVISDGGIFCPALADLSSLSSASREAEIKRLSKQEAGRSFDLVRGPLLRTMFLRLEKGEHIVLYTMHHIISDGWSGNVLVQEVITLYEAFAEGKSSPLPELPIQYADFAVWQRQWLQGEVFDVQMRYWTQQLAGLVPLKLPTDHPRPLRQTFRGAHQDIVLATSLSKDLKALSEHEGVTLFMAVLAAFQILLACYSGQDDVVVGTDVANRNRAEIEGLIGFFVNQLVLRTNLSGNPTFRELLGRVRTTTMQAYAHQDLPFEKLVEVLNPKRSTQLSPFFQVKIVWQNIVIEPQTLPGITARPLAAETSSAKLDLVLSLGEDANGLGGSFVYNADLFDAPTMSTYTEHLRLVLENIVAQPDIKLSALKTIIKKEQEQRKMESKTKKESHFQKLKTIKPKLVSLRSENLVQMDYLEVGSVLPLVIRPKSEGLELIDWTRTNLQLLETELLKHGALLFRGFGISSPSDFESFASTICPDLFGENSEHPREEVSENVYTPVFYPPEKKLLWHNENSFNASWPTKIWFFCGKPADQGGETPIADSRKVFQAIDPTIREQFMQKNVMYVRNYGDGLGLHWSTVFRTTHKPEVEAYCREAAIKFEWKDGDRLRTRQVRPAVLKHPKTGEYVWWNQATHWHPACLEPEVRDSLSQLFAEEDLPRNCYYGDGSPIANETMQSICDVYRELEVSNPWLPGDILMLDNMLTAHARNPFQGKRKIYVSMGEMISLGDIEE